MSNIVIQVENLGKKYIIRHQAKERYTALREVIVQRAAAIGKRVLHPKSSRQSNLTREEFWALRDISFEVKRGEVIGIIGRNGAGKSTLLKIFSRITEPTIGRIRIKGRVASLLEVGTGFHPELTGRENIYLNGAILGMGKAEISKKFDEIVAFAEIERFLDTPVKRYSSGMYVRLAFAVASHLEPEILLVDEVLAVGDIAFQKKCLGKMGGMTNAGRTVIFVSHNIAAIENLCSRCIYLKTGNIASDGSPKEVTATYLDNSLNILGTNLDTYDSYKLDREKLRLQKQNGIILTEIQLLSTDAREIKYIGTGDSFVLRMYFKTKKRVVAPAFVVSLKGVRNQEIIRVSSMPISGYYIEALEGKGYVDLHINSLPINGGYVYFDIGVARANVEWLIWLENIIVLYIQPQDVYKSGYAISQSKSLIAIDHRWSLNHLEPFKIIDPKVQ